MAKTAITRAYSPLTKDALALMGSMIQMARKERRQTAADLAERAGISRGMLSRIENGDPKCEVGVVFELAFLVGVPLFEISGPNIALHRYQAEQRLRLMPKIIREKRSEDVFDDF